jgi:hypothetical protein
MNMIKFVGAYPGVVTIGNIKYAHDELTVGVGMLCKNDVPDLEQIKKDIMEWKWPGSIEEFVNEIVNYLSACMDFKGVMVTATSSLFGSGHTVVTDEVLRDFDVKQEMYYLLDKAGAGLRRCKFTIAERRRKPDSGAFYMHEEQHEGYFHQWFHEGRLEEGEGVDFGAICEDLSGKVHKVWKTEAIEFLDR